MADMTRDEGRQALAELIFDADCAWDPSEPAGATTYAHHIADAVLSAPPEVLAAAMGGTYLAVNRLIVLPPQEEGE